MCIACPRTIQSYTGVGATLTWPSGYTEVFAPTSGGGDQAACAAISVKAAAASESGAKTATVTNWATSVFMDAWLIEIEGLPIDATDQSSNATAAATTACSTGSLTTSIADEYLLAVICALSPGTIDNNLGSPTGGFTLQENKINNWTSPFNGGGAAAYLDKIPSATGTWSVGMTSANSGYNAGFMVTFK